ncbi:hypothetical protein [Streptomyces montanisoli]|uniref:Tail assembly chaperone n=1 Tax=Streptomyces montanisoli TaxID=2798581 RepID=A0A940M8D6_9ACTN|nr:hypothetical protein [Streptomyces montanisoli]MBP0456253.1 hypothetical protein [Streptomyces montanisoli]
MNDDLDLEEDTPGGAQLAADFDAFFAEEATTRDRARITLYGVEYVLPESLPLMFTLQMERVQNSSDPDDVRRMLAILYGADVLDTWAEHGMTDRQLGVVLIYSAANVRRPGAMTMQRAAELYEQQEAGKAPAPTNRAARRATKKPAKKKTTARSGARS